MSAASWLDRDHGAEAAQRLLDAAGELFAERGVAAVGMADVARAAGCSRATVYRYFANRTELRTAFVHREARRVGAAVGAELQAIQDPHERVLAGAQAAIRRVRLDPTLSGWFRDDAGGIAMSHAQSSPVIETVVAAFLAQAGLDPADPRVQRRARWLVRVIVSLLAMPGTDSADERELLDRFVAAVLADDPAQPEQPPR